MVRPIGTVHAVLTGVAIPFGRPGILSAIKKVARNGFVEAGPYGLEGDEQGDRSIHGGIDKAIHIYSYEHYELWRLEIANQPLLSSAGAFGENISTYGVNESDVCLGDQFRIGSSLLEVSQGRLPCWKLNAHFGIDDMAQRMQNSLRTGFYCRIIQPGKIRSGDEIILIDRPFPNHSIGQLMEVIFSRCLDKEKLQPLLELPLIPSWRKLLERRIQLTQVEDWRARLTGS